MFSSRILLLLSILLLSLAWLSSAGYWKHITTQPAGTTPEHAVSILSSKEKLHAKAANARIFIQQKDFNASVCFLVDMTLPSAQNRFFVYDLESDSLRNSGLVTHGRCNQNWLEGRKYGNTVGCGCTSLGKYKIGNPYMGRFGLAFKLYGLDKTNDKAFNRFVVLHSHSCVPETEGKDEICQSDGCPTVAPGFLLQLKSILQASKKPVLLWIYE